MYKIIISSLAIVLIFSLTIAASDTKNTDKDNIGKPSETKTQETQSTDNPQPSVPKMINYQGKLTDAVGNPQNDTLDMTFRIYDAAIGGIEYWNETQTDVIVTDGLFNVLLGSINSIDLATEFPLGPDCYLEIIVGTQTITPRQRIVSNGYTFFAEMADEADNAANLGGVPASSYVVRPIQSEDIADEAVTMPKINQSGATNGQVIKWTGSTWTPEEDNTGGTPSGPAGGDLTGTYPDPLIADNAVTTGKIQDGQVQTDDIGDLNVTTGKIANNAITTGKIQDGEVQTADIANANVTMPKLSQADATPGQVIKWTESGWAPGDDSAGGTPSGPAGGDLTGTYPDPALADNTVNTAKIIDGQVQTDDIGDLNVTTGKIADNAITTGKIQDGQIQTADIENEAVTNAKIGANAVTTDKIEDGTIQQADLNFSPVTRPITPGVATSEIADNAVNTAKIEDGQVQTADIADLNVTTDKIADNAITTGKIQDGQVQTDDIGDLSVTTGKITDNAITTAKIQEGQVQTDDIGDMNVTTGKIADNAVTTGKIQDGEVQTADIADANVTMPKLSQSDATAGQVIKWTGSGWAPGNDSAGGTPSGPAGGDLTGTYPDPSLADNTVNTTKIIDGQVQTADIADLNVTTGKIADNAITTGKIQDGQVQTADIENGAVINAKIGANAVTTDKIEDGTIQQADLSFTPATRPFTPPVATTEIEDNAVTTAKIADGQVQTTDIGDLNVTSGKIADNAITTGKIQDGEVQTDDIADANVTMPKLSQADATPGQVIKWTESGWAPGNDSAGGPPSGPAGGDLIGTYPDPSLADNTVTTAKIQDGQVQTADIGDLNVTSGKIADNAVTTGKIQDGEVQTADIADGNVTMPKLSQADATAGQVIKWTGSSWAPGNDSAGGPPLGPAGGDLTGTYPDPSLADNTVNTAKIIDGQVQTADIADLNVTSGKIADNAVTMPKINQSGATTGQVIKWTGSAWTPQDDEGGGGPFLALIGGTMTGPITNTGNPAITMGKGNFGSGNSNSGVNAFVAGERNSANGWWSTVCGGYANVANNSYATVAGGDDNLASGQYAMIGGGYVNTATHNYATIGGGYGNQAYGDRTTIGGGYYNKANQLYATIAGGRQNFASGQYAMVGGGATNTASGSYTMVGGGNDNTASGAECATVSGGRLNTASGQFTTVSGGRENTASNWYATVSGGYADTASGAYSTVGGGYNNKADGFNAVIGGGLTNIASDQSAIVGGGEFNNASSAVSTIGGGSDNTASSEAATVGGGTSNTASGYRATVPGGYADTAAGAYSLAAGQQVRITSTANNTFAFGNDFTTSTPNAVVFHNTTNPIKVGVGTPNPDASLHVVGNIKMIDGNQAAGKVLVSDAIGLGTWQTSPGGPPSGPAGGDLTGTYPDPSLADNTVNTAKIIDGQVQTADIADANVTMPKLNQSGATTGQVIKWTGSAWAPANDEGAGGPFLAIAGGTMTGPITNTGNPAITMGKGNFGSGNSNTPVNTFVAGLNNSVNYEVSTITGGSHNIANHTMVTVGGGGWNTASGQGATVSGGLSNTASEWGTTVCGGGQNTASAQFATVCGGHYNISAGLRSFTSGYSAEVPSAYENSAAFNSSHATASGQLRCGILAKTGGTFTIDHPVDPNNKILNHYFVESPDMSNIYSGSAVLDASGQAEVNLPDYFDALNQNPRIQLTGVGSPEVYIAEDIQGNRFKIGGKPGCKVYWQVTGDRKDPSAQAIRYMMPVEQPKTGALAGNMLDDDFLVSCMKQLEEMGKAGEFSFRTAKGRQLYEDMKRLPLEIEKMQTESKPVKD